MTKRKVLPVLLHVAGCTIFLSLPVFLAPDFPGSLDILDSRPTQRDLIAYGLMIGFFYLNFFVLIPKLYFSKNYGSFFSIVFLCFLFISLMPGILIPDKRYQNTFTRATNIQQPLPPREGQLQRPPPGRFNNYFFRGLHYLFIFLALVFFSLVLQINNRLKHAEKEKLNAELLYLKAQINPHFLFNILNNIYSLAVERSGKTPGAVLKLSGMMRYVINEAGKDFVPLEKEIEYLNSYIQLQAIRFGDSVNVNFNVEGDAKAKKIAPLILIPFIENAFKYGVNAEEVSGININIRLN